MCISMLFYRLCNIMRNTIVLRYSWYNQCVYSLWLYIMISDINECYLDRSICDQICTDTEGSYECSCNDGFTKDGASCIGKYSCLFSSCLRSSPHLSFCLFVFLLLVYFLLFFLSSFFFCSFFFLLFLLVFLISVFFLSVFFLDLLIVNTRSIHLGSSK